MHILSIYNYFHLPYKRTTQKLQSRHCLAWK